MSKEFNMSECTVAATTESRLPSRRYDEKVKHVLELAKSGMSVERITQICFATATADYIERLKDEAAEQAKNKFSSSRQSDYELAMRKKKYFEDIVRTILEENDE